MVIQDFGLSVDKGDVIAILGPSGAGKTTMLRCVSFLERADSGTMIFDGKEYGVNYNCAYTLTARFQVTDSKGVKSNTDIKNITVN